jgi:hypothetical protein
MSSFTTDPASPSAFNSSDSLFDLKAKLESESERNQLQLIQPIADTGDAGYQILMDALLERRSKGIGMVEGKMYQALAKAGRPQINRYFKTHWPNGLLPLTSERNIDYSPIQELLAVQDFEEADRVTLQKMCELAGPTAVQRKWLYFTEVENFPIVDLLTLDALWRIYSEGKFGFSVQRDLWLGVGKNWDKLWPKIAWKNGNTWTRYPKEFIWDLSAPPGHLPLSNQLRGVRVMASLLSHPAWTTGSAQ